MKRLCFFIFTGFIILPYAIASPEKERMHAQTPDTHEYLLATENPVSNSLTLFTYFQEIYGKKTLSGQMDLAWNDNVSMVARVHRDTGKYPALQGFDYMNIRGNSHGTLQTYEALEWWKNAAGTGKNGIVTICWHWRDPMKPFDKGEFYTKKTSFRIPWDHRKKEWKTGSAEYRGILRDIDRVAEELKVLEKNGVPVLWRPLHEASGGWFWWGASFEDAYKALWNLMFDRLNNHHGLKNLIWVWNGQHRNWYPGDDTVDIIGEDIYPPPRDYSSQASRFTLAQRIPDVPRMIALTENGVIPHPDEMEKDSARWLYFMTWNDARSPEGRDHKESFWTGEYHNENSHKQAVYSHEDIITLDELPVFVEPNG